MSTATLKAKEQKALRDATYRDAQTITDPEYSSLTYEDRMKLRIASLEIELARAYGQPIPEPRPLVEDIIKQMGLRRLTDDLVYRALYRRAARSETK